ncbi:MAG TPA: sensor histidine kinase [Chitinophagales bacterium]|nr:sensor histidine kinase [Chitinophagales bacterium]
MNIKSYLTFIILLCGIYCYCQNKDTHFEKDSLINLINQSIEDTNKVKLLIKIGKLYANNNPDSAAIFYKNAGLLSEKLHYDIGILRYYAMFGAILNIQNKIDESIDLGKKSIALAKKLNNSTALASAYNNIAANYFQKGQFETSLQYYLSCQKILEQNKDIKRLCMLYGNLSQVYEKFGQPKLGLEAGLYGIKICRQQKDDYNLANALINTASCLADLNKFDSSLHLLKQAEKVAIAIDDKDDLTSIHITRNNIYKKQGNYNALLQGADETLKFSNDIERNDGVCEALLDKATYYLNKKDFISAKSMALKAKHIADSIQYPESIQHVLSLLSDIELATGNIFAYNNYKKQADSISSTILSLKVIENGQQLAVKYESEKKEQQLKLQNAVIRQERLWKYILFGLIATLLLIGFIAQKAYRNKQKLLLSEKQLQEQKITQLENEKQLAATQAVLKGQEEERSRLAKDLHDGLGGILSGVKYSFNNMKQQFILTEENATAFEKSMSMLDESISELRRVAHNMMPETLMKLSLSEALQDYCQQVQQNSTVQITYQSFGLETIELDNTVKTTTYRIVQELINNILKHAASTHVMVQLLAKENKLNITVEDNGKGFDIKQLSLVNGIGYRNMRSRVDFLKGKLDVQSRVGEGTSVYIEIPLA